jgi:hypothetical protein
MKREKTRISSWKRTEAGSVGFRVGSVRALIADVARLLRHVRLVPRDGVIGRPSLWIVEDFWVLRFRLMVKRGPW